MAQLKVLRTPSDIKALSKHLSKFEFIAFDTETTGLAKTDQIIGVSFCVEETEAYYVVLSYWDKETQTLIDLGNKNLVADLLLAIKTKCLLAHNSIFDCIMIDAFFGVDLMPSVHTDTMVLAHLLDENRRIGLKELGKHYFGKEAGDPEAEMKASIVANGGSCTKASYELYKADSELIGRYGAQDTILTYKLFYVLVEDLYAQGLESFFYEDECMPLLRGPTYELNKTGLKVDREALIKLKKTLEAECLEAKAFIHQEIASHVKEKYPGTSTKTMFNLGSSSQLAWLLFGKLGLEFGTLTEGGKEICYGMLGKLPYTMSAKRDFIHHCLNSVGHVYAPGAKTLTKIIRDKKVKEPWAYIACDKKTLTKLAPKYKWIERLLEYQRKTKLLSTYVEGLEKRITYGCVYPSFLQTGTTSGRYASRNPNFTNLPKEDKRIKACVVARPGKVFVGADYSQLEPRVFAYLSQDPALMAAFNGMDDFYSVIGQKVYGKTDCVPRKDGSADAFGIKYKELRDLSKVIALATVYGATARQLSDTTRKSIEETQADMDAYLSEFPGVKKLMLNSHIEARKNGFVKTLFGRPRRIPAAMAIPKTTKHADLPYADRTLLNLSTNHRVQGTAASIVNRALIAFYLMKNIANIDCRIVTMVHDSIIIECSPTDSADVVALLQTAMEDTTPLEGVPLEAKPIVGRTFAEV